MAKFDFDFTLENIEKLTALVKSAELSELTLEDGDVKLSIKGKKCPPPPPAMPVMSMGAAAPAAAPAAAETAAPAAVSGKAVKAPIVGTFYSAPSPESKPFVSVGDRVKKGDIIFIIESMKVMSEVPSEFDGVVKEICVQNGDAVEFDQTIMILE